MTTEFEPRLRSNRDADVARRPDLAVCAGSVRSADDTGRFGTGASALVGALGNDSFQTDWALQVPGDYVEGLQVAAGAYPDVRKAAEAMGRVERDVYIPNVDHAVVYDRLYAEYSLLHDYSDAAAAT